MDVREALIARGTSLPVLTPDGSQGVITMVDRGEAYVRSAAGGTSQWLPVSALSLPDASRDEVDYRMLRADRQQR